jgi:hypothetical protein
MLLELIHDVVPHGRGVGVAVHQDHGRLPDIAAFVDHEVHAA